MEFVLIYLFVMVEKIAALLDNGYSVMWGGILLLGGIFVAQALIYAESKKGSTFQEIGNMATIKATKTISKWLIIVGVILGCLGALLPSQRDLAIIVGTGTAYNVLTSDKAKNLGNKSLQLLEKKIDDALADPESAKEKVKEAEKALKEAKSTVDTAIEAASK